MVSLVLGGEGWEELRIGGKEMDRDGLVASRTRILDSNGDGNDGRIDTARRCRRLIDGLERSCGAGTRETTIA